MDTVESEPGVLEKRILRRRRMLPEAEWERLLTAYEKSGLTQRAFAQQEGVSFHTFVGRLSRRRRMGGRFTSKAGGDAVSGVVIGSRFHSCFGGRIAGWMGAERELSEGSGGADQCFAEVITC